MDYLVVLVILAVAVYLFTGRDFWRRLLSRRRRTVRAVVVRKEGYIRPNVIHGGGGYRAQVLVHGRPLEVMVADHGLYEQLREGAAMRLTLFTDADHQGWWLSTATPE